MINIIYYIIKLTIALIVIILGTLLFGKYTTKVYNINHSKEKGIDGYRDIAIEINILDWLIAKRHKYSLFEEYYNGPGRHFPK